MRDYWQKNEAGRHGNDRVDLKEAIEQRQQYMDKYKRHSKTCAGEYFSIEYSEIDKTDTRYISQIDHIYMHREWRGYYRTLHQPAWVVCEYYQQPVKNPDYEQLKVS